MRIATQIFLRYKRQQFIELEDVVAAKSVGGLENPAKLFTRNSIAKNRPLDVHRAAAGLHLRALDDLSVVRA